MTAVAAGSTAFSQSKPDDGAPVTVTGRVEIRHIDNFATGRCEQVHLLKDLATRENWKLRKGDKALRGLKTGSVVRVHGRARDKEIAVAASGGNIETITAASVETTTGPQHTVVIMVNFTDAAVECTTDSVKEMLFTGERTVDGLFQATSYGQVSFNGNVVGPYTINFASTDGCFEEPWADAADAAATADGVDLSQYPRKVYVIPSSHLCDWSGLATLGGNPSRAWVAVCNIKDLYAHELGHNLYLLHASWDGNNDGINDFEYGDTSDFMGLVPSGWRHVNAPHKEQMNWIPAGKILSPSGNGTFQLSTLETTPSLAAHPQILKFAKDPATNDYYYFSFRTQAPNYNDEMDPYFEEKVSIHRFRGENTFLIQTLGDNEVFADTSVNLQVRNAARTSNSVTLEVSRNCQSYEPWVDATPYTSASSNGSTCTYTLTIWNQDSMCVNTTWRLYATAPQGWSVSFSPANLTIAPGQNASTTVSVTPPAGTPHGSYTIYLHADDGPVDSNHTAVEQIVYQLGDSQPPTAPASLSASAKNGVVSLSWSASTDNVGVTGYRIFRNSLLIGQSSTTTYSDTPGKGSWTYYVRAVDAAGNQSAASPSRSVSVK